MTIRQRGFGLKDDNARYAGEIDAEFLTLLRSFY